MKNDDVKKLEEPSTFCIERPVESEGRLTFLEMLQSTLWALLGVQKPGNHSRDFSKGNPWHFIYMGVGFTVFFVGLLIGIVQIVLMASD